MPKIKEKEFELAVDNIEHLYLHTVTARNAKHAREVFEEDWNNGNILVATSELKFKSVKEVK